MTKELSPTLFTGRSGLNGTGLHDAPCVNPGCGLGLGLLCFGLEEDLPRIGAGQEALHFCS